MRTISFIMTGPPTADAGSFVGVVDDQDRPVDVGWWEHDGTNWRYRMPVRWVPELMVPDEADMAEALPASMAPGRSTAGSAAEAEATNRGMAARRALKEQIKGAAKKQKAEAESQPAPDAAQSNWPIAPCCSKPVNPADELLDCGNCGEPKCGECMPNATRPCADCQALSAGKEEHELESESAAPPSGALFDGKFRPDPNKAAEARAAAQAGELTIEDDEDE